MNGPLLEQLLLRLTEATRKDQNWKQEAGRTLARSLINGIRKIPKDLEKERIRSKIISSFEDDFKALGYSSSHPIISQMLLSEFNIED